MSSDFISFISCNVGVRQGENLSPVLFSLSCFRDLFLGGGGVKPPCVINVVPLSKEYVFVYETIHPVLGWLTVINAETADEFQDALNAKY